ncbi:N-acetylmuramoyl-L-alanine amidase family protein [Paenibacillus sp. 453mf]|uniref:N-acetylmuramoyl-L-alanine amidase family protein n=1 Tax=Paenibacillus sp. 453mf TaxID=1761874 RepID=UPI0008EC5552|nr:N-acetylmuramoyl-L-alanine amidase family protein [Paenibacillus sp. 453mf]SFS42419.1 N-acetylmuramoyl-L-alanine amidase [Paenibacillus sp. 453mf]
MLFFVGLWVLPGMSHAEDGQASIYLNDNKLGGSDSSKVEIINKSVMIPIRMVAEEMGYTVGWEQKTGTVTIQQNGTVIKMVINDNNALVDNQSVVLDNAPVIKSKTTLVPLRFVGEQFGLQVSWDNKTKTASLKQLSGSGGESQPPTGSGNAGQGEEGTIDQGLAQISGISFSENRLLVATSSSVTPRVFTMSGPDRIVVDLPNTEFAANFGKDLNVQASGSLQVTDYPLVSQIRYALFSTDPSTVRIVIDMNEVTGYKVTQEGTSLLIVDLNHDTNDLDPEIPEAPLPETPDAGTGTGSGSGKKIVVLDAGHGAHDGGAVGVTGKLEKDFTLSLTLKIEALLQNNSNIEVIMTRDGDTYPELVERAKIANNANADIFISVHANSVAGAPSASGTETYYKKSEDKALADIIHKHMVKATGLKDRKVKSANLSVLRNTDMPAALLEVGFLSNKAEEAILFDQDFQDRVAQSIADGIKEYLKL